MSDFFIRKARLQDAEAMARVKMNTWRQSFGGILPKRGLESRSLADELARQREHLALADQARFVAQVNQKIVAYAAVGPNRVPQDEYPSEFYGLYVSPEFQGQGLGQMLFARGRSWLSAHPGGPMIVWVQEKNPHRSFYVDAGGKLLKGTRPRQYDGNPFTEVAYAFKEKA